MRTLAQNVALTMANPGPVFYAVNRYGHLEAPVSLGFQVFATTTEQEELSPVQTFPVSGRQAVDVTASSGWPEGRYAITGWTPSTLGKHFVRWFWQQDLDTPERSCDVPFDVQRFAIAEGVPFYSSLSDLRASGVTTDDASDLAAVKALKAASVLVEKLTGRFFAPRYVSQYFDGRGSSALLLHMPIIALEGIVVTTRPVHPSDEPLGQDIIRVYNRHLTGLMNPDDRNNPRVELYSAEEDWVGVRPFSFSRLVFPRSQQNVRVAGIFGYTEPDGSPFGATPADIDLATQLLVPRYVPGLRTDSLMAGRIQSEGTRDQNYSLMKGSDLGLPTNLTGDPAIDALLMLYMRPLSIGAA